MYEQPISKKKALQSLRDKAPWAEVVDVQGERVTVLCPLCHMQHYHSGFAKGRIERRVAACGVNSIPSREAKSVGYRYKVTAAHV